MDFVPAWQDGATPAVTGRRGLPMEEVAEEAAEGRGGDVPLTVDGTVDRYGYGYAPNGRWYYGNWFANGIGGRAKSHPSRYL